MNKAVLLLGGVLLLSACTSNKDPTSWEMRGQETSVDQIQATTPAQLTPQQGVKAKKAKKGPYNLDPLTQKLRQDLSGCGALVKMENHQVRISVPALSVFGQNKTTIRRDFKDNLYDLTQTLKTYSQTMVRIIGYTGNDGPVLKNKALSLKQAQAIADFFKTQGIAPNRLLAEGKGPEDPLTTNATLQGRHQNYRIEILIVNLL